MALPRGDMGLSAVCDCGISLSYSLTIFHTAHIQRVQGRPSIKPEASVDSWVYSKIDIIPFMRLYADFCV